MAGSLPDIDSTLYQHAGKIRSLFMIVPSSLYWSILESSVMVGTSPQNHHINHICFPAFWEGNRCCAFPSFDGTTLWV